MSVNSISRKPENQSLQARFFGPGSFKYWSIAPLIIVLFVFTVLPIFQLLQNSVSELTFVEGELVTEYIGLGHFDNLAKDPRKSVV